MVSTARPLDGNRLRTRSTANSRIFRAAENRDDSNGMGTTVVGVLVIGSRVSFGHVGDSRVYLIGNGTINS